MNITIELIDEMRKRTNCSYQEAKELLEKHNGDLIEAIIEFESSQPARSPHCHHHSKGSFGATIKKLFHKGSVSRFIIEKNNETYLNVPVIILALIVVITIPFFWFYLLLGGALISWATKLESKEAGQTVGLMKLWMI